MEVRYDRHHVDLLYSSGFSGDIQTRNEIIFGWDSGHDTAGSTQFLPRLHSRMGRGCPQLNIPHSTPSESLFRRL